MFFCATRWLEDASVAEISIDVWDNVVKIFEFWGRLPKLKCPKCKSYGDFKKAIQDDVVLAKLHFFATVANVLKPFLMYYQTTNSMVPFLYDDRH